MQLIEWHLFILLLGLPSDTLEGHRARFVKQFKALRQFYIQSSVLQYFKTLIQIPMLEEVFKILSSFNVVDIIEQVDVLFIESAQFPYIQWVETSCYASCCSTLWSQLSARSWRIPSSSAWIWSPRQICALLLPWFTCRKVAGLIFF